MKSLAKLIVSGALMVSTCIASAENFVMADAGGKLTFSNKTGETISVVVNDDPNVGVPIGADGKTLDYWLVRIICSANVTSCNTKFFAGDMNIGYATLNAKSGALNSYEAYAPFGVVLDENAVPLREVLLTHE